MPGCLVGAYTRVVRMTWLWMVMGGVFAAAGNTAAQAPGPVDARKPVMMLDSVAANVAPQLAGNVLAALRDEVERSRMFRMGPTPPVSTRDLQMTLGCQSMDEGCLRRANAEFKAEVLLFVELDRTELPRVRLRVLHAGQSRSREVMVLLRSPPADVAVLRNGLRDALHRGMAGRLDLTSSPAGATTRVDGVVVGVTPCSVDTLAPGPHAVVVALDGFVSQELKADVRVGEPLQFHLALVALPKPAEPKVAAPTPAVTPSTQATPQAPASSTPSGAAADKAGPKVERPLPRVLTAAGGAVAGVGGLLLVVSAAVGAVAGTLFFVARLAPGLLLGRRVGAPVFWTVNGGALLALVILPVAVVVTLLGALVLTGGVAWIALE